MNFQHKGTFESKRVNNIYEYGVYGKTVKHRLYAGDKKERYFHLYHSISKESAERAGIENRLNQMTLYLKKYQNKVKEFGPGFAQDSYSIGEEAMNAALSAIDGKKTGDVVVPGILVTADNVEEYLTDDQAKKDELEEYK